MNLGLCNTVDTTQLPDLNQSKNKGNISRL